MTHKEQIEEVTKIINSRCEAELGQVHSNSKDGKVTKTVDTSLIAKDIISAGYHKTIWHKIADNDLPKDESPVYAFFKAGWYATVFYLKNSDGEGDWYALGRLTDEEVVAWTELSKYKE